VTTPAEDARQDRRFRRISAFASLMPRKVARVFSYFRTRWVLMTGDFAKVREILASNLEPVVPDVAERRAAVERLLRNYGMFLTDYFRIPAMKAAWMPKMFRPLVGQEHVAAALKAGKGAILVTPHLGNWELGGIAMLLLGMPVTGVAVPDPLNPAITRFRDNARRIHGMEVLNIEPGMMTPIALARALGQNRLVAMLADRNFFETDPVEVDYFGRKAYFPRGPGLLSLATDAPVLPAFVTMGTGGKYDAEVLPPVPAPAEGDKRTRAGAMVQALAKIFEQRIRAHPDQWYVFDPFWGGAEPVSNLARAAAGIAGGRPVSPLK